MIVGGFDQAPVDREDAEQVALDHDLAHLIPPVVLPSGNGEANGRPPRDRIEQGDTQRVAARRQPARHGDRMFDHGVPGSHCVTSASSGTIVSPIASASV